MKALRNQLVRSPGLLRLAAAALAIYLVMPVQLVWCQEEGDSGRIEPGFIGQCLPGPNGECCGEEQGHGADQAQEGSISLVSQHDHCVACNDDLVHQQGAAQLCRHITRVASSPYKFASICVLPLLSVKECPAKELAISKINGPPPQLGLVHAETTLLLL